MPRTITTEFSATKYVSSAIELSFVIWTVKFDLEAFILFYSLPNTLLATGNYFTCITNFK